MSRVTTIQSSFNSGEFSPKMTGRTDISQYPFGLRECTNLIPLIQGPLIKRPGTSFIVEAKSGIVVRVVPFVFGTVQSYVIEFGNLYMRFIMNDGQIQIAGVPVEVATSYLSSELFDLKFVQNADVMWILHPNHKTQELTRTSDTSWTMADIVNTDGPYQDIQPDLLNLITPSAVTGTITLTAVSAVFVSTDVGRQFRFRDAATNWTWMEISSFTSSTVVTAIIKGPDLSSVTASNAWRLGAWSDTTGYPSVGTFHQNRLVLAGTSSEPFIVDGSNSGDYRNFSPTLPDGTVTDAHSYRFPLLANEVNSIRWMESDERGMLIGTSGAEWLATASVLSASMTPTNLKILRVDNRGSANVSALKIGKVALYLQRSKKKIRKLAYTFNVDGFVAPDLNQIAEHITGTGIIEMAYQQEPVSVVWAVREDGKLIGFTFEDSENVIGWHVHDVGGLVKSICVIPNDENLFDELIMVVQRTINNGTRWYIEDLDSYWSFQSGALLKDATFIDSSLKYTGASTTVITGLAHLEGETVTILGDGLVQSDKVVSGGQITLDTAVTSAVIGLRYKASAQTLRETIGSQNGTTQNKTKRINRVAVRVNNSQNISIGPDATNMEKITQAGLFSGDIETVWPQGYDNLGEVRIEHDDPLPLEVNAIIKYQETYDR